MTWKCPQCHRTFRQLNQRHACGIGDPATLLKDRPPELAALYRKLETTIHGFGAVEVVTLGTSEGTRRRHFALDTKLDEIAELINHFLDGGKI